MILGIGVDIEDVTSFRQKPVDEHQAFYRRLFSQAEIDYCAKFKDSAERFAARFCAKEALVKALGSHLQIMVTDAEVGHEKTGVPVVAAREPNSALADFLKRHEVVLSLSHTANYAVGMVIVSQRQDEVVSQKEREQ